MDFELGALSQRVSPAIDKKSFVIIHGAFEKLLLILKPKLVQALCVELAKMHFSHLTRSLCSRFFIEANNYIDRNEISISW